MTVFSDYIVYADESGDHGPVSKDFPVFVLAFCIFEKRAYAEQVTTALTNFKFKWFGHDAVVLHEREIRKQKAPFGFLSVADKRNAFMADLGKLIEDAPFTLIATVIRKELTKEMRDKNNREKWPTYETAMQFNLERLDFFLNEKKVGTARTEIVFEMRGTKEDNELELAFRRKMQGRAERIGINFAPKTANHCGHQIADLIARPIGQSILFPDQANRTREIIRSKFRTSGTGKIEGYGLKVFP